MPGTGGHGIVIDGPNNPHLRKALEKAAEQGKIVSAVCHGPAAFVKAEMGGKALVQGKKVCVPTVQSGCFTSRFMIPIL